MGENCGLSVEQPRTRSEADKAGLDIGFARTVLDLENSRSPVDASSFFSTVRKLFSDIRHNSKQHDSCEFAPLLLGHPTMHLVSSQFMVESPDRYQCRICGWPREASAKSISFILNISIP